MDDLNVAGWQFDAAVARAEAAEAQLAAVRSALGGYPDSDLVSLATTISAALSSSERELEQARSYVDEALSDTNPDVPLVDRIVRLVSVMAIYDANVTHAENLNEQREAIGALAQRIAVLEDRISTVSATAARITGRIEERLAELEEAIQADIMERIADRKQLDGFAHRLAALERDTTTERLEREDMSLRLENVARRARLPLPSGQMRDAYDADHDAFPVSYWDMRLLAMIEQVNDRLAGVAEVSDGA